MVLNFKNYRLTEITAFFGQLESIKELESPTFTLSVYENDTPGSGRSRSRRVVETAVLTPVFLSELQQHLSSNAELAINSLIISKETRYHLAMIDFQYPELDSYFLQTIAAFKKQYPAPLFLFRSGRSFHGYQDLVLTERAWRSYLGSLLLLNRPGHREELVDSRWVGHSLLQGFAALRLTKNTRAYLQLPALVKIF
jgi:hypothetical protein